jgi:hypothetical protein
MKEGLSLGYAIDSTSFSIVDSAIDLEQVWTIGRSMLF